MELAKGEMNANQATKNVVLHFLPGFQFRARPSTFSSYILGSLGGRGIGVRPRFGTGEKNSDGRAVMAMLPRLFSPPCVLVDQRERLVVTVPLSRLIADHRQFVPVPTEDTGRCLVEGGLKCLLRDSALIRGEVSSSRLVWREAGVSRSSVVFAVLMVVVDGWWVMIDCRWGSPANEGDQQRFSVFILSQVRSLWSNNEKGGRRAGCPAESWRG